MAANPPATLRDTDWDNLSKRQRRALLASVLARTALTSAGLVVVYSMVPIGREATVTTMGIMVIGTVLAASMLVIETRALARSPHPILRVVQTLTTVLVVFILAFATVYLSMAESNPLAFSEPITKVSAIYFTVTVLATVGFGDITPVTDAARIVVTMQMVLGLTLVAVVVRFMVTFAQNLQIQRRSAAEAAAASASSSSSSSSSSDTADVDPSAGPSAP